MTTYYLVRHGQTEWNRVERFRGRLEIPLNALGRAQAQAVAARLASSAIPIARIYSSPLGRARETAEMVASALGQEVEPLPALMDINYGLWQGQTPEEVARAHPELYRTWLQEPQRVRFPQGESLALVYGRVALALQALSHKHPQETTILVSHQAVNKVILSLVLGLPPSAYWKLAQDNACLNRFHWEEGRGYSLGFLNDTCHLEGLRL